MPSALPSLPMVLLRHTLPDGTHHFDWLLSRCTLDEAAASPETRDVITLRVDTRPDLWTPLSEGDTLDAQQLPDHRRLYLAFAGELSPNTPGGLPRGHVQRIAIGHWSPASPEGTRRSFNTAFNDQGIRRWTWIGQSLRHE